MLNLSYRAPHQGHCVLFIIKKPIELEQILHERWICFRAQVKIWVSAGRLGPLDRVNLKVHHFIQKSTLMDPPHIPQPCYFTSIFSCMLDRYILFSDWTFLCVSHFPIRTTWPTHLICLAVHGDECEVSEVPQVHISSVSCQSYPLRSVLYVSVLTWGEDLQAFCPSTGPLRILELASAIQKNLSLMLEPEPFRMRPSRNVSAPTTQSWKYLCYSWTNLSNENVYGSRIPLFLYISPT